MLVEKKVLLSTVEEKEPLSSFVMIFLTKGQISKNHFCYYLDIYIMWNVLYMKSILYFIK